MDGTENLRQSRRATLPLIAMPLPTPPRWTVALPGLVLAIAIAGCGGQAPDSQPTTAPTTAPTTVPTTAPTTTVGSQIVTAGPWPTELATVDPAVPVRWTVEIVDRVSHDPSAFTQGLEATDTVIIEGTGLVGKSELRLHDRDSAATVAAVDLPADVFGEGLTVWNDTVVQLTWKAETAYRWQLRDLSPLDSFAYEGEGWGLCASGDSLVMSNGSSELTWRDPVTFEPQRRVTVTRQGEPVSQLNELECVDGYVLANIWQSSTIVVVRGDGAVVASIDASALVDEINRNHPEGDVLNGIAWLGSDEFLLGGKLWPTFFIVRFVAPAS